jgi:hypothetical protein
MHAMDITAPVPHITRIAPAASAQRPGAERRSADPGMRRGEWLGRMHDKPSPPAATGLSRTEHAAAWYRWIAALDAAPPMPRLHVRA